MESDNYADFINDDQSQSLAIGVTIGTPPSGSASSSPNNVRPPASAANKGNLTSTGLQDINDIDHDLQMKMTSLDDDDDGHDGIPLSSVDHVPFPPPPMNIPPGATVFPVALPYPITPMHNPFYFTQPHHNPYSPTGGAGHLHPPAISQLPIPTQPDPYDPTEYLHEEPLSSSDSESDHASPMAESGHASGLSPQSKRTRKTNATVDLVDMNRPIEELYTELPEAPAQDPTTPKANVPRFRCRLCETTFPRKNAMVAHIKTHLGKRRYTCSQPGCGVAFVREHDCKRHEATHTGSRPFVCPCGRPFARPDALRRHRDRGRCHSLPEGQLASKPKKSKGGRPSNIEKAQKAAGEVTAIPGTSTSSETNNPSTIDQAQLQPADQYWPGLPASTTPSQNSIFTNMSLVNMVDPTYVGSMMELIGGERDGPTP